MRMPQGTLDDGLSKTFSPWLLCPAVVTLDDTPVAADLLYGSHANPLSNAIHIALSCAVQGAFGDPERLAQGQSRYY